MQSLSQCNVTSISQSGNDQTRRISEELVIVSKVGIANVDKTVVFVDVVPSQAELRLPAEAHGVIGLFSDQLGDDITSVHIECTNSHNHLTIELVQVTLKRSDSSQDLVETCLNQLNQVGQLSNLLLVVILH